MNKEPKQLGTFQSDEVVELSKVPVLYDEDGTAYINVDKLTKRVPQEMFWKVYLTDFLSLLGLLDSRQVDVLVYLCSHTSPHDNMFYGTYREIADGVGCSLDTVTRLMKRMQERHFLIKVRNGAYRISAALMMQGSEQKRQILLTIERSDIASMGVSRTKEKELPAGSPDVVIQGSSVQSLPSKIDEVSDDE